MKILESKFVQGFIKMADDGYKQGWHERNGGNLSYRLKAEEVEMIRPRLNAPGEWTPIGVEVPGLAGEFFLVTGSGKYFRNIIVDPEVCLAIIELDETGTNYRIRWGLVEGGRPTSELPTHLMNHEVKKNLPTEDIVLFIMHILPIPLHLPLFFLWMTKYSPVNSGNLQQSVR
ncbi:Ribulose-5-phosphate 4-epimerase and related epimerases and aldolases [Ruminococcus sp. SR1/5]|nr:Ribulose-5-phosphate 4-epimerase and related epimerases and aldolases [Ruminococcus sp. SR1/5]